MIEEEKSNWRKSQNRYCLYFDGASKKNLGKVGARRIILDPDGKENFTYG